MHKDHLGGGSIFKLNQKMFLKCDLQIWKVEGCVFAGVGPQSSACFSFLPLFLTLPDLVMSLLLAFDSVKKIAELLGSHFLILLQTDFSKPKSCLSLNCQSAFGRGGSERWELLPGCGHCTCLGSNSCFPLHPLQ